MCPLSCKELTKPKAWKQASILQDFMSKFIRISTMSLQIICHFLISTPQQLYMLENRLVWLHDLLFSLFTSSHPPPPPPPYAPSSPVLYKLPKTYHWMFSKQQNMCNTRGKDPRLVFATRRNQRIYIISFKINHNSITKICYVCSTVYMFDKAFI